MNYQIGIIDDHPAMLIGAKAMFQHLANIKVVNVASTVRGFLQQSPEVNLVLLDLCLSDGSTPTENLTNLRALDVPVLIFTSGEQPDLMREASRAGAIGVLMKSTRPEDAAVAVVAAAQGEVPVTVEWASALAGDVEFTDAHLSDREKEVLELYASGLTAEAVADALFLSRTTVYDHIRRIRTKYASVDREAPTKIDLRLRALEDNVLSER